MKDFIEFLQSVFPNADDNTIATIVVTIFVFLLGYLVKELIDLIKREVTKSEVRNDLRSFLKEIGEAVYEQHLNFDKFYKIISVDRIGHHLMSHPINQLNILTGYNYKEVRSAFLSFFRFWQRKAIRNSVNALFNKIGLLRRLEENYQKDLAEFFDRINKYEIEWNRNVEALRDMYDRSFRETEGWILAELSSKQVEYINFLKEADKIRNYWISANESERLLFSVVKERLLDPTLKLCRESKLKHEIIPNSYNYILGATYAFNNLEVTFSEMKFTFGKHRDQYAKISRSILNSPLLK